MRFRRLSIRAGATVTNAWLQFEVDEVDSVATSVVLRAEAADNSAAVTQTLFGVSSRARTTASVTWTPPPWTVIGAAGADQRTPSLVALVQEVVNRPGWASGNALMLIATGSGRRTAQSFEGKAAAAPLLHVEYVAGTPPANEAPSVSAGADQVTTVGTPALLDGTVTDDGLPKPPAAVTVAWSQVSGPAAGAQFASPGSVDTSVSFSESGTYVFRLTASDGERSGSDDVSVVVNPVASGSTVVEARVSVGSDDAEERPDGTVDRGSSDLEFVLEGGQPDTVGMRFRPLSIPAGATITNAWLQFEVDEVDSVATSVVLRAEAADNSAAVTQTLFGVSSRARTTGSVTWTPPPWTVIGAAGADQRTPSLAALVQEVVNRPGWASGNALMLIATGSGRRTAQSFEGKAAAAPLLHVEYVAGTPPANEPPSVSAGADQVTTVGTPALLDGTVTDDGLPKPPGAVTVAWSQVSGPAAGAQFASPGSVDTSVSFSESGTYVFRLTASDGERSGSDDVSVVVNPVASGSTVVEARVSVGSDDAEERPDGTVDRGSSDLEFVLEGGQPDTVGMRFRPLSIPAGATITNAWLQFEVDEVDSVATSVVLRAEAADNSAAVTQTLFGVSSRARTTGSVTWAPPPWTVIGAAGADQRTPSLAALVQEVVNRPGWASGNALMLSATGSGRRTAQSFEGKAAAAPLLHVEYTQ